MLVTPLVAIHVPGGGVPWMISCCDAAACCSGGTFLGGFLSSGIVVYSLFLVFVFVAFPVGVHALFRYVSVP